MTHLAVVHPRATLPTDRPLPPMWGAWEHEPTPWPWGPPSTCPRELARWILCDWTGTAEHPAELVFPDPYTASAFAAIEPRECVVLPASDAYRVQSAALLGAPLCAPILHQAAIS